MTIPKDGVAPAPGKGYQPGEQNTALQCHTAFFDRDGDGIIWPLDTYVGFRSIGFGVLISLLAMVIIHAGFSYVTWGSILPDPFFRLKIKLMHRAKHGSDTEVLTSTGEFDEARFDAMFDMYSSPPHKELSFGESLRMVRGNMDVFDPFGWFAGAFEWITTYLLLWPEDGRMKKEDVRAVYDGTIFYRLSGRRPD